MTDVSGLLIGGLIGGLVGISGPIAGAALGARLARASSHDSWRRDQRTQAYAALLLAAHDLQDRMTRTAENPAPAPPLNFDDILRLSKHIRTAATPCELFAGDQVRLAISDLISAPIDWSDTDPGRIDLLPLRRAVDRLSDAMRHELDPPRRRILRP
jgi:hypothetical protein